MDQYKVLRLLSPKRKGWLRWMFSRAGITLLLIALEVFIIYSAYNWLAAYFVWFQLTQALYSIGMIIYLFNNNMDATAKLTWLFLIMLFPVPATILLWYTQTNLGHRLFQKRTQELQALTQNLLPHDPAPLQNQSLQDAGVLDLQRYLNRSGCFPLYEDTEVIYFPLGEDKFAAMLEELSKAEKFIYLEYFILEEGQMWGQILQVLSEKAAQGVDVRVMYDGMCEISLLSGDYPKRLEKLGIKCKPFSRIYPFISTHYNYRDHRKILVIDGKVAFNGGVNLADEYINRRMLFGHWKDTALLLRGRAVQSFTLMFLQMWNLMEAQPEWEACATAEAIPSEGFVMPYGDCPFDEYKVGKSVYLDILYRAKKYVYIMTPYLILDNELEAALKFAAGKGIDVKLILPGIPDKKAPYALAKSHYPSLTAAGVNIYEYSPGFIHAKTVLSDDEKAVVGTINFDYRSLYHHFECATFLYKTRCLADIKKDFDQTLEKCRRMTPDAIKREKWTYKLLGRVMKIFAPLM